MIATTLWNLAWVLPGVHLAPPAVQPSRNAPTMLAAAALVDLPALDGKAWAEVALQS